MEKQKINRNNEVTRFLDELNHPFRNEIEQLRDIILSTDPALTENVKWNGPNYRFDMNDRITMKIHPLSNLPQLIFHRGSKKHTQPADKLISRKSPKLYWKENDRAIMSFKDLQEIENEKAELTAIITEWISATKSETYDG